VLEAPGLFRWYVLQNKPHRSQELDLSCKSLEVYSIENVAELKISRVVHILHSCAELFGTGNMRRGESLMRKIIEEAKSLSL
jgi:hypothetical protein